MNKLLREDLKQQGFILKKQSVLTKSLKRFCNQDIKKIEDDAMIEDNKNTM